MKTNDKNIMITDIQRFCMHDGPGIRTTVFFKGCPLNCAWCHNPETKNPNAEIMFLAGKCISCGACVSVCPVGAQSLLPNRVFDRKTCIGCGKCVSCCFTGALTISGKNVSAENIIASVKKDLEFYGEEGGLTVSGGEPTFQKEGLLYLLDAAKSENISTCIETCGAFPADLAEKLVNNVDYFLFDIKDTNKQRLKQYTGAALQDILLNLFNIDSMNGKIILRCIIIPNINMNQEHINNLLNIFSKLNNAEYIELLPYHPYGNSKSEQLGRKDTTVFQRPTENEILEFAKALQKSGCIVKCHGSIIK